MIAPLAALGLVSVALLLLRLWAAFQIGFGDSEALYATWALHPQPAYLDHPGLVGLVARAIGGGIAPEPLRAHLVTAVLATLVPWMVVVVARAAGASRERAAAAGLVVAVVPETAVGLFALTPDLLLAPLWLGALGCAVLGLSPSLGSPGRGREAALLGAGLLAGIAASAKISGLLLMSALATTYALLATGSSSETRDTRSVARSIWPWAGLAAGVVVLVPIARYEALLDWPMFRHRLVATQSGAGLALRNLGALLGGQLVYLSPVVAWLAVVVARDLYRQRSSDVTSRLLWLAFALPLGPLLILCLWSPVAEPHWIAPALLPLPIHAARSRTAIRFVTPAAAVAAAFTVAAHLYVLVPAASRLAPTEADPRADIASELYGWPVAVAAVREQMRAAATPFDPDGREVVVVGPHWTVCAQLHAALEGVRVGCATPIPDDFDRWVPRAEWRSADDVLFVTDARFPTDGADQLPGHVLAGHNRIRTFRGGRPARVFDLYLYSRRATGSLRP
jgi:hypothetical protein